MDDRTLRLPTWIVDHPVATILAFSLFCSLPLLIWGVAWSAHDSVCHIPWTHRFAEALWSGDPYPRWLSGMNEGYGSPVFYYYPPMGAFGASLFYPLKGVDPTGSYRLALLLTSSLILSGLFARRLALEMDASEGRALVAALFYVSAPYHLAVDIYLRGAVAEALALTWLPLLLLGLVRIQKGDPGRSTPLVLGTALLLFTHLLTAMIVLPVILLASALLTPTGNRLRAVVKVALLLGLGHGIAAVYLLPALTQTAWVRIEQLWKGWFSYSNFFLPYPDLQGPREGSGVSVAIILTGVLLVYVLVWLGLASRREGRERRFWSVVAIGSIVMVTWLSWHIWPMLGPLERLQFPWRFFCLTTIAFIPLIALPRNRVGRLQAMVTTLMLPLFLLFSVAVIGYRYAYSEPKALAEHPDIPHRTWDPPEYWPACIGDSLNIIGNREAIRARVREPVVITGEERGIAVGCGEKRFHISLRPGRDTAVVRLPHFYFPLWQSSCDDVTVLCGGAQGLLEVRIPPDVTGADIVFVEGAAEKIGGWISLAALLALSLLTTLRSLRRGRSTAPPPANRVPRQ